VEETASAQCWDERLENGLDILFHGLTPR
jgi:hypothetical protein